MALYEIENLSFLYPNQDESVLNDINLKIIKGQFIIVCGPSGSGKTTLLKHLKKDIMPSGKRKGNILYNKQKIEKMKDIESVQQVGMVFQNPEEQIVMDTPINEICFSMENLGFERSKIKSRLAEISAYFGLENILHENINELSGGQKQIVNLCSVLSLQPEILILDEPSSQLDPLATKELINMIEDLNNQLNITIIMSVHSLDPVLHLADKIIYLENGSIVSKVNKSNFPIIDKISSYKFNNFYLPSISKLKFIMNIKSDFLPITIKDGRKLVNNNINIFNRVNQERLPNKHLVKNEKPYLKIKSGYFSYEPNKPLVLKNINLNIYNNEFISILGSNGSGKSTLIKIISGLLSLQKGSVKIGKKKMSKISKPELVNRIGYIAQNPLLHFTKDSVLEEINQLSKTNNWKDDSWIVHLVELFNLENVVNHHPYDLSGGQQQKLAILLALSNRPDIICLDEPTKGLDPISKNNLASLLTELKKYKTTIITVTHDIEFAANYSDRSLFIFDKEIIYDGNPREFFTKNRYYTTTINQVFKEINPKLLTVEEIKKCLDS